jgi:hypothetical protein
MKFPNLNRVVEGAAQAVTPKVRTSRVSSGVIGREFDSHQVHQMTQSRQDPCAREIVPSSGPVMVSTVTVSVLACVPDKGRHDTESQIITAKNSDVRKSNVIAFPSRTVSATRLAHAA